MPMSLEELLAALLELRQQLHAMEQEQAPSLAAVAEAYRASARNLLHFIAFHRHNHPGLQAALRQRGLSTLAGCDPHLLASLNSLIAVVQTLLGPPASAAAQDPDSEPGDAPLSFAEGHALLRRNGEQLLGSCNAIMVTLPAEAAASPALVDELVAAGMDIARINCAHDDPDTWAGLAHQVRAAAARHNRPCRIAMDLAGPKLRTGSLPALPGVIAARPQRDRYGRLLQPAQILAVPAGTSAAPTAAPPAEPADPALIRLPVLASNWDELSCGDRLRCRDASGRWRELVVREQRAEGLLLHCRQHCRFVSGLVFRQEGGTANLTVAPLPDTPGDLLLRRGDRLRLTPSAAGGTNDASSAPATISCSLPEALEELAVGDRVLFDDGKLGARVVARAAPPEGWVELEITQAKPRGTRLRADKGINLPDTTLGTPALTAKDLDDLSFACHHADLINYSFVRSEADIACLQAAMAAQVPAGESGRTGLVLKIETRQAFLNLPRLLLAAMGQPTPLGVMIARGDLAIECGWEALSAIQEEILRICAAAHVPCIWATQVLETMAQHGTPTRPEITDAAMGARAEALMLNKGANITEAVRSLRRIVERSGITRSDNSTDQPDQMLCCLSFSEADPAGAEADPTEQTAP